MAFKGFKSLFVKSEPNGETTEQPSTSTPLVFSQQPLPVSTSAFSPTVIPTATTEDFSVFYEQLQSALEEANLPTKQDYIDLRKALENMSGLAMDEITKYKAAFATLQSVGCDINELLESFTYYQNVIDSEKHKFSEATQAAISDAVLEKQRTLEQLTKKNATNAEKIKQLTEETHANSQQITTLQVEVSTATSNIEQKKMNFQAAFDKLKSEMEADRQKIQMYVGSMTALPKTKKTTKK